MTESVSPFSFLLSSALRSGGIGVASVARTKTAPWDYRHQVSTAAMIAEAEKIERVWDESLARELPTYEQALQRIAAWYGRQREAIDRRWYRRILSPWENWEAARKQRDELVAVCNQAKAIARALRRIQWPEL